VIASYIFVPTLNGGLAIGVLGTALVIAFGQSGWGNAILANKQVVHVGKISYSLYLWHWPVLVFADTFGFASARIGLIIPIYFLSLASYWFVESPARRSPRAIPAVAVSYLAIVALSLSLAFAPPFYDTSEFEQAAWIPNNCHPHQDYSKQSLQLKFGATQLKLGEPSPDAYLTGGIIDGAGDSYPQVVVLGDSHGCMWSDAILAVTQKLGVKTSLYVMDGVSPFVEFPLNRRQQVFQLSSEEKYLYDKSRLDFIRLWKPQLVIICAQWSSYKEANCSDLLLFLEEHASNVLLMEQPPVLGIGNRNAMQYLCFKRMTPESGVKKYLPVDDEVDNRSGKNLVQTLSKKYKNCDFIPTYDLFYKDSQALVLDGKNVVYLDDDHLVSYGTRLAMPRLEKSIISALKNVRE